MWLETPVNKREKHTIKNIMHYKKLYLGNVQDANVFIV